eukprot:TRINITY_DN48326_c0_g1_i1.p1 TRINITY_DN48326_c0_g1~~TRINITY_DN48326_c0_g1_i1.p1  ORF type:complete len:379 (+),score=32.98 TRINITY_DN48326_c0_g1_i1:199-1335(+)
MGCLLSVEVENRNPPASKSSESKSVNSTGVNKSVKSSGPGSSLSKQKSSATGDGDAGGGTGPPPARRLKLKEFFVITNNFDETGVLGEGSFGKVYKGLWDETPAGGKGGPGEITKTPVAVKKLNPESFQGYEEWLAEVLLLDKLRHPNLVRLIGYCAEKGEALLMYELCPNGSLDQLLFEPEESGHVLSWEERVRIAMDAAKGLAYLHENNIIHRDFKASNILIAEDYSGRLTDFGMARAGPDGGETHISTRVMGTLGYLDPTYMETGRLTKKSDVYAFGVLLLELLTGRRTTGDSGNDSLTTWIRPFLSQRRPDLNLLVDPQLKGEYSKAGAVKMAILGKHCIHDDPGLRPDMSTLAENLELVDLKDPAPPPPAPAQ